MKVIFPGSFNPVHNGHIEIIKYAISEYDRLFIYVANNENKKYFNSLNDRFKVVKKAISNLDGKDKIEVHFQKPGELTPTFAQKNNIEVVIRGLINKDLNKEEDFLSERYLDINPHLKFHYFVNEKNEISSTKIRNLCKLNKDVSGLVPPTVEKEIKLLWRQGK